MRLSERREALGLSQRRVGVLTGISQSQLSHYEAGDFRPKYDAAKKLAELYGCTVDEIMDGCGKPE